MGHSDRELQRLRRQAPSPSTTITRGSGRWASCLMERTIDDLPLVFASTLVANGLIKRDATTTRIRFAADGVKYQVGVRVRIFKNNGFWARFVCPRCNGSAQRLRLLGDKPACGACVRASGLIYRSQATRTEKRYEVTAPPRIARLNSGGAVSRSSARAEGRPPRRRGAEASAFNSDRAAIWRGGVRAEGEGLMPLPAVPDTVRDLDVDVVIEVLSRHAVNVSEAAREFDVNSADLRRLLWARPQRLRRRPRWRSVAWILRSGIFLRL